MASASYGRNNFERNRLQESIRIQDQGLLRTDSLNTLKQGPLENKIEEKIEEKIV